MPRTARPRGSADCPPSSLVQINWNLLDEATAEVTAWLQFCYDAMEKPDGGRADLQPDPFYARNHLLTESIVEAVVKDIELGVIQHEIDRFPAYHHNAQSVQPGEVLVRPGFTELPYEAKMALVQGLDRIMQRYRVD